MSSSRSRSLKIAIVVLILLAVLALLLARCSPPRPPVAASAPPTEPKSMTAGEATKVASTPAAAPVELPEKLDAATVKAPASVLAGAPFTIEWTGPNNDRDYVTIVRADAPASSYGEYEDTSKGASLTLKAPVEAGAYEVRYVTSRSKTVLGRAAVEVLAAAATLKAPAQVVAGADFSVEWTGPKNASDYITVVPADTIDGRYQNYTDVAKGSPLQLTALIEPGPAEVRYMTGTGAKVLARRPILIVASSVSLSAPARAVAGSVVAINWEGPNHRGDYVTVVTKATPDGKYAGYADTAKGSPAKVTTPIESGPAEVRYMTGQGAKVLARRAIEIDAAVITLEAPAVAQGGETVSVTWTGPANSGDYLTVVLKSARDGQYADSAYTDKPSPVQLKIPADAGPWEVRYMSGQGARVLARREIRVK